MRIPTIAWCIVVLRWLLILFWIDDVSVAVHRCEIAPGWVNSLVVDEEARCKIRLVLLGEIADKRKLLYLVLEAEPGRIDRNVDIDEVAMLLWYVGEDLDVQP